MMMIMMIYVQMVSAFVSSSYIDYDSLSCVNTSEPFWMLMMMMLLIVMQTLFLIMFGQVEPSQMWMMIMTTTQVMVILVLVVRHWYCHILSQFQLHHIK